MSGTPYHGIDNLDVMAQAVRYHRFLARRIVDAGAGSTTALDFGAGTGLLATLTRERGLKVACVEVDPELRTRLRSLGLNVHDDLDRVVDRSQEFIYSVNVLEHIEDDEGTLRTLCSKLAPGGRCFLYVPALSVLFSSMDEKIGHYRRYERLELVEKATKAGFAVEGAEYADSVGFFATLVYKAIGSRGGHLSPASVRFYDRLVFPVSRVLDRAGCSRWFGKNLMVVMHRARDRERA